MYLSKSKYVRFWSCPKAAWLNQYRPEAGVGSNSAESRMQTGTEVGALARGLFGPCVDCTVTDADGRLNLAGMIEKTEREMARGTEVLCEASFSFEGLYCAVDLLRRDGEGWAIYEVKSTCSPNVDSYTADVAYQKYVLEKCGLQITGVYLVCLNSQYVYDGNLDLSQLFMITDKTEEARKEELKVPATLAQAERVLSGDAEPEMDLAEGCLGCDWWGYCTRELPAPNVFDLYRLSKKKKIEYYQKGLVGYDALRASGLIKNATQKRQMDLALEDLGTWTEPEKIREFLDTLSYPLYFLDFESMQPAVPFCIGTRPYAQIPFQYSLHVLDREGGELRHLEYLAESGTDPRRGVAEALCRDIPMDVCVTAYNKNFECTRLKELAEAFPDLAEHLLNIAGNIRDLLDPFQKGFYYNRAMGGSYSIKSVLPAIYPDDPALDYHNLEGVHNGGEAMAVFPQIQYMPPEEQKTARENLLHYCELDTLAMVRVWEELVRVGNSGI